VLCGFTLSRPPISILLKKIRKMKGCNNVSPYKLAEALKMNAWADIPSYVTPVLLTDIEDRRDNRGSLSTLI